MLALNLVSLRANFYQLPYSAVNSPNSCMEFETGPLAQGGTLTH